MLILCVNKPRQSMKTKSICKNEWQNRKEKKHSTNKQHLIEQQVALSKQELYTALYTRALK